MANANDVGVIHMSLQGIPPGKRLHTTSNHQSITIHIRSGLHAFLVGHPLLDAFVVQVSPVHRDPTARPPARLHPTIVSDDMALEVGNTLVHLDVVAPDDGALEV